MGLTPPELATLDAPAVPDLRGYGPALSGWRSGAWERCVNRSDDSRSKFAIGFDWASRITTVGLEFALPPLLGAGLDRWWGTRPLAVLVGAVLGFTVGMMHLLRIAREGASGQRPGRTEPRDRGSSANG